MYPASLFKEDTQSPGEAKLYNALRDQLDDSWDAYHSTSWTENRGAKGSRDGEIDFVVAHPEEGVLCIEAKGGAVSLDEGRWLYKQHGEWKPYKKDPFVQAVDNKRGLDRMMGEMPGWRDIGALVGHAVSFPEVPLRVRDLPPNASREFIFDRDDVRDVDAAVRRALAYHRGRKDNGPGRKGMQMLHARLMPTFAIEVPLAETFLEEEQQLIQLTHGETQLLRRFGRNRRMAVSGCAGSGKTTMAVEQAKWLKHERDLDVAVVCFNRRLRDHLQEREGESGVEFFTFHSLCVHLGHRARVDVPKYDGDAPQEYWDDQLPEVLVDATATLGGIYDALMIDEAQDLHNHWLTALMSTLRDEQDGVVWLFMDSNQQIYDARLDVPGDFQRYSLIVNCRNTQAIHREVMKKYEGEVTPSALGPEGRAPELIAAEDQAEAVAGVIERLCGKEELPPQDVVVLSSHGFEKSQVAQSLPGRYRLVSERRQ
ncbi:MAG: AAA family ATPase, partial [Solirubrobacterales bacterium]